MTETYHTKSHNPRIHIRSLSAVQQQVLLAVGYYGPITPWDIAKNTKTRRRSTTQYYGVAHKAIKNLKQRGLVEVVGHGKGERGATTLKYDLTIDGIWMLIGEVEGLDFAKLAKNQDGRGLLWLKKWEFLESKHATAGAKAFLLEMAGYAITKYLLQGARLLPGFGKDDIWDVGKDDVWGAVKARVSRNQWAFFSLCQLYDDELAEFWIKGWKLSLEKYRKTVVGLEENIKKFTEYHSRIKKLRQGGLSDVEIQDRIYEEEQKSIDTKESSAATKTQQM